MTRFKCGGLAIGFSWAHIIGDPHSLSHFFNLWTRALAGEQIYFPKTSDLERCFQNPNSTGKEPVSIKRVDPVGDLWVAPSNSKMTTYSFNVINGHEYKNKLSGKRKCVRDSQWDYMEMHSEVEGRT